MGLIGLSSAAESSPRQSSVQPRGRSKPAAPAAGRGSTRSAPRRVSIAVMET